MAYVDFHQCDPDFEGQPPIFYDTDNSPVYEQPYGILLQEIIHRNDLSALHRYNESPHTRLFIERFEIPDTDPFSQAFSSRSFDVLRALIGMYQSDPSLTEPLNEYGPRITVYFVHQACSVANQELVLWLLNQDPPLGSLTQHDYRSRTPLACAAEALGQANILMGSPTASVTGLAAMQRAREDHERAEKLIYWLMDNGCTVSESNIVKRVRTKRSTAGGSDEVPKETPRIINTVLGLAIPFASYEMTSHLISKGANILSRELPFGGCHAKSMGDKATPLHIAASHWNLEGIQALFDHRGNVSVADLVSISDDKGQLPLHWAVCGMIGFQKDIHDADHLISRMLTAIKTLLDIKPETVNSCAQDGSTVFHDAVHSCIEYREILESVELLLRARPSLDTLNSRNHKEITALGEAIRTFKMCGGTLEQITRLIVILVENGANARRLDKEGRNILHRICMHSFTEPFTSTILDQLLKYVDINENDYDGRTAISFLVNSVTVEQIDAMRDFITRGADVTKSDKRGDTPLHYLIIAQIKKKKKDPLFGGGYDDKDIVARDEAIQVLINAGASLDLPNEAGQTPRQMLDEF